MIELKDVTFTYESGESTNSLRNINLTIREGETILLCGESGCGKTTLTRLLNGLIPHYYEGNLTGMVSLEWAGNKENIHYMKLLNGLAPFFKTLGHNSTI